MFIIRYRKIIYILIGLLSVAAIGVTLFYGLTIGIEFTGGTLTEVSYAQGRPDRNAVEVELEKLSLGEHSLRNSGDNKYLLRTKSLDQGKGEAVKNALSLNGTVEMTLERNTEIGPVIGEELRSKAWVAIGLVILTIILYVTFVFRQVSEPVSSWMYGVVVVFVLVHDLLIPIGMFALFGHFLGAEIDVLFVMAVLTILGYSVNDTIVVFDRVRENLRLNAENDIDEPFDELVGSALMQTLVRSINTSVTTFLGVMALLVFGGEVTRYFALTLAAGVVAGTYSSILLASPLLVTIEAWQRNRTPAPVVVTSSTSSKKKNKK
jgi:preprotein translocase subunit SecF